MIVESISIAILFLILIFIFIRAKKPIYAMISSPLLVVPAVNIAFNVAKDYTKIKTTVTFHMLVLVISLAIAVLLIGFFAHYLKSKRTKLIYISTCGGFTTALTIIFLYNLYFI